jgi:ribonucleoside-diphosphate reductase beta chain
LLQGLASGTSWVFRDESAHIEFALEVIETTRRERPELFDESFSQQVTEMIREAVECEMTFAEDTLSMGVSGLSITQMREYLQYVADRRLESLRLPAVYGSRNPFAFMELQDVQELTNFFERRVSAYQVGVVGDVAFGEDF